MPLQETQDRGGEVEEATKQDQEDEEKIIKHWVDL